MKTKTVICKTCNGTGEHPKGYVCQSCDGEGTKEVKA